MKVRLMPTMPTRWFDVSTENGQVVVCFLLLLISWGMHMNGWETQANTLFLMAFGVLARSMGTGNGNIKGTSLTAQPAVITDTNAPPTKSVVVNPEAP